jgi:hypothetical protein
MSALRRRVFVACDQGRDAGGNGATRGSVGTGVGQNVYLEAFDRYFSSRLLLF